MFLANFRKELREDGLGIARAGSDRRQRARAASAVTGNAGDSGGERKSFQEACFKWNLGRPSRATKRVLKFILGSGFTVLALGASLSVVGFVLPEANPFRIIGPVLAVYGLLILFLSFDVCMRLKAAVPSEMEPTDGGVVINEAKADDLYVMEQKNGPEFKPRIRPSSPIKLRSWGGDKMKGMMVGRNGELVAVKTKQQKQAALDEGAKYIPQKPLVDQTRADDGWFQPTQPRVTWQTNHLQQPWDAEPEFSRSYTPSKMDRKGCG